MLAAPSSRPALDSLANAAYPFPAGPWSSTSRTSGPGAPVAMARFQSGWRPNQAVICSGSVVASRWPWAVAGIFCPAWQGNTGQPRAA